MNEGMGGNATPCHSSETMDYFDRIIGLIEDIVISAEFQERQNDFLDRNYEQFTEDEENRICYTEIFNEYTATIEKYIVDRLRASVCDAEMNRFLGELRSSNRTFDGEIYELLYSLTDFPTFKSLMLDYKQSKTNKGHSMALDDCFIITKL